MRGHGLVLSILLMSAASAQESRQASGVKVGEVTDSSAVVWVRHTAKKERKKDGIVRKGRPKKRGKSDEKGLDPSTLEGSCPGAPGQVISVGCRTADSGRCDETTAKLLRLPGYCYPRSQDRSSEMRPSPHSQKAQASGR